MTADQKPDAGQSKQPLVGWPFSDTTLHPLVVQPKPSISQPPQPQAPSTKPLDTPPSPRVSQSPQAQAPSKPADSPQSPHLQPPQPQAPSTKHADTQPGGDSLAPERIAKPAGTQQGLDSWEQKWFGQDAGPVQGPPSQTSKYTLEVGDSLDPSQKLVNGQYSLGLEKGNLVLKDKIGNVLWESGTTDDGGAASRVVFRADGSLDIKVATPYQELSKWSSLAGLSDAAALRLNDDGSLVVVDKNGTVLQTIRDKDSRSVVLQAPMGSPKYLKSLVKTVQNGLQDTLDYVESGRPKDAPDTRAELRAVGFHDTSDVGEVARQYEANITAINKAGQALHNNDIVVKLDLKGTADTIAASVSSIWDKIKHLKEVLQAPQHAQNAPSSGKAPPIDIHYTPAGNIDINNTKLSPDTVTSLIGALNNCLDDVDTIKTSLEKELDTPATKIRDQAPGSPPTKTAPNPADPGPAKPAPAPGAPGPGTPGPATPGPGSPGPGTPGPATPGPAAPGPATPAPGPLTPGTPAPGTPAPGTPASGTPTPGTPGTDTSITDAVNAGIAKIVQAAATSQTTTGGATSGSSGDQSSGLMNTLLMINAMKSLTSQDNGNNRPAEQTNDRDGKPQDPAPAQPQPAAAPDNGAPPSTTAPTDAKDPAGDPNLFPGHPSQSLSPVVAEAFKFAKEHSNDGAADAAAAYQGTPGDASTWTPIEPAQVHTGDVVKWANRSALLWIENGKQWIVMKGQLVELDDPWNPPNAGIGAYGAFEGYRHPPGAGIDATPVPANLAPQQPPQQV
ncbi:hypothetical protein [Nocardia tengchongensis]|uniref:hypothetical protein n=1 Tax=Nocardia tengchongensis TaxID=2055889 RepID=UPI003611AFB4